MKKLTALVLALALALGTAACGKKEDPKPTGGQEVKQYKFGIIYTANNAFWDKVGDGGLAKAAEYKEAGKYNIEIYASGPPDHRRPRSDPDDGGHDFPGL